jgi:hypothetical protein
MLLLLEIPVLLKPPLLLVATLFLRVLPVTLVLVLLDERRTARETLDGTLPKDDAMDCE